MIKVFSVELWHGTCIYNPYQRIGVMPIKSNRQSILTNKASGWGYSAVFFLNTGITIITSAACEGLICIKDM